MVAVRCANCKRAVDIKTFVINLHSDVWKIGVCPKCREIAFQEKQKQENIYRPL